MPVILCSYSRMKGVFTMYDNNFLNEQHATQENGEQNTELRMTGGRFSSQASSETSQLSQNGQNAQNVYGSANVASNQPFGYYGGSDRNYGYGTGTYQSVGQEQKNNSYHYSNAYPPAPGQPEKQENGKEKKGKSGGGYLKKALICVSLGLFFGLFAGVGFYMVNAATGVIGNNAGTSKEVISQNLDTEGTDAAAEDAAEQPSSAINALTDSDDIEKTQTVYAVVSDVSDVVSAVMPAVVSISNTYTETMSYFGQSMSSEAVASGSGIIVGENDTELLIVTNYHVIQDADVLTVQFVEGSEAEASVKGTDADMDLAIIAVPLENIFDSTLEQIAIATLGDSDGLKVGEPAIAIGNSLGYGQSVTTGVISALNRDMELSDGSKGTFIQTDAAINPGNSGGALLNISGEVIGINSNKIGGSVVEGMGYAIPISAASPIIADLMLRETKNKVAEDERGYLGISGISVTTDVSSTYGMPEGVYVAQVYDGTAASAAGLEKGNIITSFDGVKIKSMDELQKLLEYYAKGDTVDLTVMVISNGGYRSKTVSITLGNKVEQ